MGGTSEAEELVCVFEEVESCHCDAEGLPCCESI
jgi:hypothetical protein